MLCYVMLCNVCMYMYVDRSLFIYIYIFIFLSCLIICFFRALFLPTLLGFILTHLPPRPWDFPQHSWSYLVDTGVAGPEPWKLRWLFGITSSTHSTTCFDHPNLRQWHKLISRPHFYCYMEGGYASPFLMVWQPSNMEVLLLYGIGFTQKHHE